MHVRMNLNSIQIHTYSDRYTQGPSLADGRVSRCERSGARDARISEGTLSLGRMPAGRRDEEASNLEATHFQTQLSGSHEGTHTYIHTYIHVSFSYLIQPSFVELLCREPGMVT